MPTPVYDPKPFGKELVNSALTGAGLGTSAMALYYLLNGLNTAKIPKNLLREPAPETAPKNPTAPPEKKKRKIMPLEEEAKTAGVMDSLYEAAGKTIPTTFNPFASADGAPSPTSPESPTVAHAGWRTAANVAALLGGLYGGRKLVNAISQHKKKKDLADEVNDARKQYFAALTGKEAAALDAAFENYLTKQAAGENPTWFQDQVWNPAEAFTKNYVGIPLWRALLMTGLGTGALGAHYAYNRTREQSKSQNLQKARQSRARLKALQETPWVDPAELEALSAAAK